MEKTEYSALIGTAVASFILGIVILITGFGVFIFIKQFQRENNNCKLFSDINKTDHVSYHNIYFQLFYLGQHLYTA